MIYDYSSSIIRLLIVIYLLLWVVKVIMYAFNIYDFYVVLFFTICFSILSMLRIFLYFEFLLLFFWYLVVDYYKTILLIIELWKKKIPDKYFYKNQNQMMRTLTLTLKFKVKLENTSNNKMSKLKKNLIAHFISLATCNKNNSRNYHLSLLKLLSLLNSKISFLLSL